MPYFWRQGQSRNEAIGHLSKLPLHLGYRGCSEAPGEVQAKQFRMQHPDVFWEYHFLKLVNGCFCDTKTCNSFWRLSFQNIKYLMHLGKNIYLSKRFDFTFPWYIHENFFGRSFYGCLHRSNGTKTWLNAPLLKTLKQMV